MLNETTELLNLVKASLRGDCSTYDAKEGINYHTVYRIAVGNSVANTVADLICSGNGVSDDVKQAFTKQKTVSAVHQVLCDRALTELFKKLDEKHIKAVFLKGSVIKKLYINPVFRSMSDIDVFAESADMDRIYSLMTELQYEAGVLGRGNHYEYSRDRIVKIEFHPELVALDSDYGRTVFSKIHPDAGTIAAKMDLWNHTAPIDGHTYALQLVPEYHYLYVIMHMMAHFLAAGTGIRSVMDVWTMNRHYANSWNRQEIEGLLSEYGLATFEKYALSLADKWFDLSGLDYLPKDIDEKRLSDFEAYILGSGTYGTVEQSINKKMNFKTNAASKWKYLFSRFFLPYKEMKEMYPVLKKVPVLLPFLWIHHAFDCLVHRRKQAIRKMNAVTNADSEKVKRQKELTAFLTERADSCKS